MNAGNYGNLYIIYGSMGSEKTKKFNRLMSTLGEPWGNDDAITFKLKFDDRYAKQAVLSHDDIRVIRHMESGVTSVIESSSIDDLVKKELVTFEDKLSEEDLSKLSSLMRSLRLNIADRLVQWIDKEKEEGNLGGIKAVACDGAKEVEEYLEQYKSERGHYPRVVGFGEWPMWDETEPIEYNLLKEGTHVVREGLDSFANGDPWYQRVRGTPFIEKVYRGILMKDFQPTDRHILSAANGTPFHVQLMPQFAICQNVIQNGDGKRKVCAQSASKTMRYIFEDGVWRPMEYDMPPIILGTPKSEDDSTDEKGIKVLYMSVCPNHHIVIGRPPMGLYEDRIGKNIERRS